VVKCVVLRGYLNAFTHCPGVGGLIDKRELEADGRIKVIQKIAPALKYRGFVLVLRQLVIDVLILNRLCKKAVSYPANTVLVHILVGYGFLRRPGIFIALHSSRRGRFLSRRAAAL